MPHPVLARRRLLQISATLGLTALACPALAQTLASPAEAHISPLAAANAALERLGDRIAHRDVVGVADFGLPSSEGRLYLVDMASGAATSVLVAHGRGSDPAHTGWLSRFSNEPGSDCTSEGAFLIGDYYVGAHGRSMRVVGLDPTNSNAYAREIVVHCAPYVGPEIIRAAGVLGRSEGCFAVSPADLPQVLDRLAPGRLLVSTRL